MSAAAAAGVGSPDLSIVIPTWNTREITRRCLASIQAVGWGPRLETIVVDNGSRDGTAAMIQADFPSVILIRNPRNLYFSHACNQGAARASGRLLCVLNSDTRLRSGSLQLLIDFLDGHPEYGAVGPRFLNADGTLQSACRRFPRLMEVVVDQFSFPRWYAKRYRNWAWMAEFDHLRSRDVDQPLGACLVMRLVEFRQLGGFDEILPLFYSDVDLCRRLWKSGRRIRYLAEAEVEHLGSASVRKRRLWRAAFVRDQLRYFRKHHGRLGAVFHRTIVMLAAIKMAGGTLLGPRPRREKRKFLRQLRRQTRISLACR